jgi:hypothetical protein
VMGPRSPPHNGIVQPDIRFRNFNHAPGDFLENPTASDAQHCDAQQCTDAKEMVDLFSLHGQIRYPIPDVNQRNAEQ